QDRDHWNLMYGTAGIGEAVQTYEVADLAQSPREYELFGKSDKFAGVHSGPDYLERINALERERTIDAAEAQKYRDRARLYETRLGQRKPYARLSTGPWS